VKRLLFEVHGIAFWYIFNDILSYLRKKQLFCMRLEDT